MNKINETRCKIEMITNPSQFYGQHSEELALVGANAFGQSIDSFESSVAERFGKSGLGQIMRDGKAIVGFALYDIISGYLWRPPID